MRIRLSVKLTIAEICKHINAKTTCDSDDIIEYVTTDSREIENGDLFFALQGKHGNGEEYVTETLCKKAWVITTGSVLGGINVENTGEALLSLAKYYKSKLKSLRYTVAITGSVGKTTTKEFLNILISKKYKVHKTLGNFNNEIGVPISIISAPAETEVLIAEVGMNHPGEISRISRTLTPDIAVITNIGTAHIGNLGSRNAIAEAKLEVLEGMYNGSLIVPSDEPLLKSYADYSFSISDKNASYCITENEIYENETLHTRHNFPLSEEHFLICLAAAVAAARCLSLEYEDITPLISKISYNNTRQKITRINNYYIIEDYYNASLESICSNIRSLAQHKDYSLRSALIGDVLELGALSAQIHRKIGEAAANSNIDKLFIYGKYSPYVQQGALSCGFPPNLIFINEDIDSPEKTAYQIINNVQDNEIILFKASRAMHLENVLELLLLNSQTTKRKE